MNERIDSLRAAMRRRRLDLALVSHPANIRSLTGLVCDAGVLLVAPEKLVFYTDFRYIPMVHRLAPKLMVRDVSTLGKTFHPRRVGFEETVSYEQYAKLKRLFPRAVWVAITTVLRQLRAVKSDTEQAAVRAAVRLNDQIWAAAQKRFRVGMTEREMARIIRRLMVERGEGEAFETIVCVGKNAAECHHIPDETVWNGRDAVLVDMGVRFRGVCSDMTRNLMPRRCPALYRQVYQLVLKANERAIALLRPGMTARQVDKLARDVIKAGGFGKCFGHALGHGVGYEIHESPTLSRRDETVLRPGMLITIEPGVYLEGNLGVRIEDLVLVTETGCEVLSQSPKNMV